MAFETIFTMSKSIEVFSGDKRRLNGIKTGRFGYCLCDHRQMWRVAHTSRACPESDQRESNCHSQMVIHPTTDHASCCLNLKWLRQETVTSLATGHNDFTLNVAFRSYLMCCSMLVTVFHFQPLAAKHSPKRRISIPYCRDW